MVIVIRKDSKILYVGDSLSEASEITQTYGKHIPGRRTQFAIEIKTRANKSEMATKAEEMWRKFKVSQNYQKALEEEDTLLIKELEEDYREAIIMELNS